MSSPKFIANEVRRALPDAERGYFLAWQHARIAYKIDIGGLVSFLAEHRALYQITAPDYDFYEVNPQMRDLKGDQEQWDEMGMGNPDCWHVYTIGPVAFYDDPHLLNALWAGVEETLGRIASGQLARTIGGTQESSGKDAQ